MKSFDWNDEKNALLRETRGVSFDDVVFCIEQGLLLGEFPHPNKAKYPGQHVFVVEIDGYAYLVPFVESDDVIFLKTIIPSRKATRDHMGGRHEA